MISTVSPAAKKSQAALVVLDLTLPTPAENLALDEALLNEAEETARRRLGAQEMLRFWESPERFVTVGSAGRLAEEVEQEACAREAVPVLRRASGGGAVVVGPGCLCFSLILSLETRPELVDIHRSYRAILERTAACLDVAGLEHRGISDLALDGRKVSGNAQRRKSRVLLHHGTILCGFEVEAMAAFLKHPPRQPDYRAGRPHTSFATNLALPGEEIKRRLSRCWNAISTAIVDIPDLTPLIREKYGNATWTRRF